jgi:hypothetical protein
MQRRGCMRVLALLAAGAASGIGVMCAAAAGAARIMRERWSAEARSRCMTGGTVKTAQLELN